MKQHKDIYRLNHMLVHAREASGLIAGKERESLAWERLLELALVRLVEIIGEAASKVSPEGKQNYPSIPWREVINMRNRLIHGYDSIDLNVLWDTIDVDLPELIAILEDILNEI